MSTLISNDLWIISALVFGAVLLGVQALYWILIKTRSENKGINRRLTLTAQLNSPSEVLATLRRERGFEFLAGNSLFRGLNTLLVQSGLRLSGGSYILLTTALALFYAVVLKLTLGSSAIALLLSLPAAIGSTYLYLTMARARRVAAFSEQFPDALDVAVRGLRAGHPFRVALALVAREMPDPVGSEFGILTDEVMFGLDQSAAIDNLCKRVGHPDLAFFATAVNIQQQTGGNLAEILSRLSRLVRHRTKLRLKIRALSSEGRLSAIALSLAPFALVGIISLLSPDYFGAVLDHPVMHAAAGVAAILLLAGNIVMYRMVNFKF